MGSLQNKMPKHLHHRAERGYTLLFAVITASILLSIAVFIVSVSRKQFILASSARDFRLRFLCGRFRLGLAVDNMDSYADNAGTYVQNLNFNTPIRNANHAPWSR